MSSAITVLMPVYNAEKYLAEAMESILHQTFSDFYFLIINDGSSDKSEEIILSYQDQRIIYVKNEKNIGLVATLNKGIDLVTTKYIVRMDADDLSYPGRLEILYRFMEAHPSVGVFSSALERFGDEVAVWKTPLYNDDIKAHLLFGSSIGHAPSIIRSSVLKENKIYYRDIYLHMEDYDLWLRLMNLTEFANTEEVLYKYRVANHNVTVVNQNSVILRKKMIFTSILNSIDIQPTEEELLLHIGFENKTLEPDPVNIRKYRCWLDKLLKANEKKDYFPKQALIKLINQKWQRLFFFLPEYSYKSVFEYIKLSGTINFSQLMYVLKFTFNSQKKRLKWPDFNNK